MSELKSVSSVAKWKLLETLSSPSSLLPLVTGDRHSAADLDSSTKGAKSDSCQQSRAHERDWARLGETRSSVEWHSSSVHTVEGPVIVMALTVSQGDNGLASSFSVIVSLNRCDCTDMQIKRPIGSAILSLIGLESSN